MGYCIEVTVRGVRIAADKVDACLVAVNQLLVEDETTPDWLKREYLLRCYDYNTNRVAPGAFSWLMGPRPPATSWATLKEAFYDWRFDATVADNGDVVLGRFRGEKVGDEEVLWRAIAPFVSSGSGHINVDGEDSRRWRYVFQDGKVRLFCWDKGVWQKMAFLADETRTQERIRERQRIQGDLTERLAERERLEKEEVDAARFQQIEEGVSAETPEERAGKAEDEVDSKRFRVMLDKEPPAPAEVQQSPLMQLSSLILPGSPARDTAPSPVIVRLMGVRNRGVQ